MLYLSSLKNTGIPAFGSSVKLRCLARNEGAREASQILSFQSKEELRFQFRNNNHHWSSFLPFDRKNKNHQNWWELQPTSSVTWSPGSCKTHLIHKTDDIHPPFGSTQRQTYFCGIFFWLSGWQPQQPMMGCNFASESNALNGTRIGCWQQTNGFEFL